MEIDNRTGIQKEKTLLDKIYKPNLARKNTKFYENRYQKYTVTAQICNQIKLSML
jgi:hypothetical protein